MGGRKVSLSIHLSTLLDYRCLVPAMVHHVDLYILIDCSLKVWAKTNPFFRNCFCNISFFHSNEKVTNTLGEGVSQLQRMKAKADVIQLLPEMLHATQADNRHTLL